MVISALTGLVSAGITAFAENRKEKIKQKAITLQKKTEMLQQRDASDAEWENTALRGAQDSWKDEYLTVIFTLPFILLLIGALFPSTGITDKTKEFMDTMTDAPDWIQHILTIIVYASFGLRGFKSLPTIFRKGK
uniref:TMhelix containing protein n=1 Tax=Candidatus Kentrum sp. LPFa TaxID=2126335 RepID=A0A450W514_9GAMM|nr:MAG: hypothetical protein BECKLPF1236B_GA0070989_10298 [Candidatus Kentron sp. LPFa]